MALIIKGNSEFEQWLKAWDKATPEDRKRMEWEKDWNELKEIKKDFLLIMFPDILRKDKSKLKPVNRCIISALNLAIRKKYIKLEICSRCGGNGNYSYNMMHGTMCYGCGGKGQNFPRITKKMIQDIKSASN